MIEAHGVFHGVNICYNGNSCAIYKNIRFAEIKKAEMATVFPGEKYTIKTLKVEVLE
jgi:hypothetical protein